MQHDSKTGQSAKRKVFLHATPSTFWVWAELLESYSKLTVTHVFNTILLFGVNSGIFLLPFQTDFSRSSLLKALKNLFFKISFFPQQMRSSTNTFFLQRWNHFCNFHLRFSFFYASSGHGSFREGRCHLLLCTSQDLNIIFSSLSLYILDSFPHLLWVKEETEGERSRGNRPLIKWETVTLKLSFLSNFDLKPCETEVRVPFGTTYWHISGKNRPLARNLSRILTDFRSSQ